MTIVSGSTNIGLFLIAFLYFAFAIGAVTMLFLRPRQRRRSR